MTNKSIYKDFKPTYLMIKQHKITGLKYFCKTTKKDPVKYLGSGVYWREHLKEHGKFVQTIWCKLFDDKLELKEFAEFFSEEFDIVKSPLWANKKLENGLDGGGDAEYVIKNTKERVANGTHNFIGLNEKRLLDGTHNFLSKDYQSDMAKQRVANGTHHFLGSELQLKRVANGTHPFLGGELSRKINAERVANGTHPFLKLSKQKTQRPLYLEVKGLFESYGVKKPKGLNMKSDSVLLDLKTELTEKYGFS